EVKADVIVPVSPEEAFAAVIDLDHADWLPAVRSTRHIGGPRTGAGARYEVQVGVVGRHLHGILVCREETPPTRAVFELEEGMQLTIMVTVTPVVGGCSVELLGRYTVGSGPWGVALQRASAAPARRELARAIEQFAARFGRKAPAPAVRPTRRRRVAAPGGARRG
ncbi:MAG TPA: SRPBCC family protein, partial [Candidatus Sulfotelmatobacter sp.]|nr:SRPBCC family protein [Candidatus Sulfotelmatobacter sp.]